MQTYKYEISGTAAHGQTWVASGMFAYHLDRISDAIDEAHRQAFEQLTEGNAVYGHPGESCDGPYMISKLVIEKIQQ
jgi:hypothetical protein